MWRLLYVDWLCLKEQLIGVLTVEWSKHSFLHFAQTCASMFLKTPLFCVTSVERFSTKYKWNGKHQGRKCEKNCMQSLHNIPCLRWRAANKKLQRTNGLLWTLDQQTVLSHDCSCRLSISFVYVVLNVSSVSASCGQSELSSVFWLSITSFSFFF